MAGVGGQGDNICLAGCCGARVRHLWWHSHRIRLPEAVPHQIEFWKKKDFCFESKLVLEFCSFSHRIALVLVCATRVLYISISEIVCILLCF